MESVEAKRTTCTYKTLGVKKTVYWWDMLTLKLLQMYCYISNCLEISGHRQMQKGNVYNKKGFSRQRIGKIADVSETAFTCRLHTLLYVRSKCCTSCLLQISAASRQFPHRTHPLVPIILSPLRSRAGFCSISYSERRVESDADSTVYQD